MAIINGTNFNDNNTVNGVPFVFRPALSGVVDPSPFFPFPDQPDTINGLAGNDILNALGTNDTLNGGAGDDILNGNGGNDTLNGGTGNDRLNGGLGSDTMNGGLGNDTYVVNSAADVVNDPNILQAFPLPPISGGIDTVESSISYTLGSTIENLTLTGFGAINGTGNALNNIINGNGSNNVLSGLGGNDTLNGGLGNDTLNGGDGNDILNGSAGNDVLNGGNGNDTLNGGPGADTMNGGFGNDTYIVDNVGDVVNDPNLVLLSGGVDTVQSSISYALGATIENLTLTGGSPINGIGNTLNNVITGNSGNNILSGRDGNDTVSGLAGNDTLNGGNGNDGLSGGDGNDVLIGGNGADSLNGGSGADIIFGDDGNDVLTGGLGMDVMEGGNGADRIDFNLVTESPLGAFRDIVTGFSGAGGDGDKIDLSTIDANAFLIGNQAFGAAQLTFAGGILTADVIGGGDLQVALVGAAPFSIASDVIA